MNINLTPNFEEFVQESVASGRYGNVSEVMRAAPRLLEDYEKQRDTRLSDLQAALDEGGSSPDVPYDIENVIARGKERRAKNLSRGRHA